MAALCTVEPCMKVKKTIKTHSKTGFRYVRELCCEHKMCGFRQRIIAPEESVFALNVVLQSMYNHQNHHRSTWLEHYRDVVAGKKVSKRGLPPYLKQSTDAFALSLRGKHREVWRKVYAAFQAIDPLFLSGGFEIRKKLEEQVIERSSYSSKKLAIQSAPRIKWTSDLINFKLQHRLKLPPSFRPVPMYCLDHVKAFATKLEADGYLTGVKHQRDCPHFDMIVLDFEMSSDVQERYNTLLFRREKEKKAQNDDGKVKEAPKDNMIIFSSISLLSNICFGQRLNWEISLSADGTHDVGSNDYILIPIGIYHINNDGTKTFRPLLYAFCPGEIELCVLLALDQLRIATRLLFNIYPVFKGGMISDCSEVFVNSFKLVFPKNPLLQCYPHIARKFRIDGERTSNGGYRKNLTKMDSKWLQAVAGKDVQWLRLCRTFAMFNKGASLVSDAWVQAGESKLLDVFANSYLKNPDYCKWWYAVVGIPGCIPQNQSIERNNLDIKGCRAFSGVITTGRNMTAMIGEEFPKLIFNNSGMRYGVGRGVPMLDDKRMLSTTSVLEFYDLIQKSEDIVPYQKGFLINTEEYVGTPIRQERIFNYEKSLAGEFESDYASRSTFFGRVNGFCFVDRSGTTTTSDNKEATFFRGTCFQFYNYCWCPHAAVVQYDELLSVHARKLPDQKNAKARKRVFGQKWHDEIRKDAEYQRQANKMEAPVDKNTSNTAELMAPQISQTQDEE
jgi:hypothetical protein